MNDQTCIVSFWNNCINVLQYVVEVITRGWWEDAKYLLSRSIGEFSRDSPSCGKKKDSVQMYLYKASEFNAPNRLKAIAAYSISYSKKAQIYMALCIFVKQENRISCEILEE